MYLLLQFWRQCQRYFSNFLEDLVKTRQWKREFTPFVLLATYSQHFCRWTRETQFYRKLQRHHPGGSLSCKRWLSTSGTSHLHTYLPNLLFCWKGWRTMLQVHENTLSGTSSSKGSQDYMGREWGRDLREHRVEKSFWHPHPSLWWFSMAMNCLNYMLRNGQLV